MENQTGSYRPGIIAWEGIQVIEDVTDKEKNPGIETLEGRIGPLMKADHCQAHYIEMHPGLFCEEHAHSTESIIVTLKGKWVLCSGGRRQVMKPGTLFWFAAGTPTGYEVPFDEPAFLLIFKGQRDNMTDDMFLEYLRGLNEKLKKQNSEGTPFTMGELPADHPAISFYRALK